MTFQELILTLQDYWTARGCLLGQPYDVEKGAGTFNPHTFLRSLGPEPWNCCYVEPCRRPTDGRYGENPNRFQHYFQFQVVLKPSPDDVLRLYEGSLEALGLDLSKHDLRYVEDDWESPTIGAWGLGWEVWLDGMEVTQFTYFQQVGGLDCRPVTAEITYGLERIAMYLQGRSHAFDIVWGHANGREITYGEVYRQSEVEWSHYNFEQADVETLLRRFAEYEQESLRLNDAGLVFPAYEAACKASHTFNLLQARGAISVTERAAYIRRVRRLACRCAEVYVARREELGFPLLAKAPGRSR